MPTYSTPTVDSLPWGGRNNKLFRYYGAIPVGITVYKDANGDWRTLPDFFEEEILADAQVIYRGGRDYELSQADYDEVTGAILDPGEPEPEPENSPYPGVAIPGNVYPGQKE